MTFFPPHEGTTKSHQFVSSKKMQTGSQLCGNLTLELSASRPLRNQGLVLIIQLSMELHYGRLRRLRWGLMSVSCSLTSLSSGQGAGVWCGSNHTCVWVHITVIRNIDSEGKLCRSVWVWIVASIWTNHVTLNKLFTLVSPPEKGGRW